MKVIELDIEQRSDEWLKLRNQNIGASDIPIILGISPYSKTIHDLWLEKTGRKESDPPNYYMVRGSELEPDARAIYIAETGITIDPVVLKAEGKPYMASLDGWNKKKKIVVEIKCPESINSLIKAEKSDVRIDHYAQNQWQLKLAKDALPEEGEFMGYIQYYHPDYKTVIKQVLPNLDFQESATKAVDAFWDLVINDIEPENIATTHIKLDDPKALMNAEALKVLEKQKDEIEAQQEVLKKKIVECSDGGNFEVNGIRYTKCTGRITINYKEFCQTLNLKPEDLKPFTKQGNIYARWEIKVK